MKKKLIFNNTYQSGAVTYLIFKEKDKFVGVCLEFDLEIEANTAKKAMELIEDYSLAWHKNIVKKKLPEELLNKPAPKKYWKIFEDIKEKMEKRERIIARVIPTSSFPVLSYFQPYNPQFPLNFLNN